MSTHIGFRVRAKEPVHPYTMSSDDFELREAAVECASLLQRAGWTQIEVFHATTDASGEQLKNIDWGGVTDTARRLSAFKVTPKNVVAVKTFLVEQGA